MCCCSLVWLPDYVDLVSKDGNVYCTCTSIQLLRWNGWWDDDANFDDPDEEKAGSSHLTSPSKIALHWHRYDAPMAAASQNPVLFYYSQGAQSKMAPGPTCNYSHSVIFFFVGRSQARSHLPAQITWH